MAMYKVLNVIFFGYRFYYIAQLNILQYEVRSIRISIYSSLIALSLIDLLCEEKKGGYKIVHNFRGVQSKQWFYA